MQINLIVFIFNFVFYAHYLLLRFLGSLEVSCNVWRWKRPTFYCCSIPERGSLKLWTSFFFFFFKTDAGIQTSVFLCYQTNADDCEVYKSSVTGSSAHSGFVFVYNVLQFVIFSKNWKYSFPWRDKTGLSSFQGVFFFQICKSFIKVDHILVKQVECFWIAPRPETFLYSVTLINLPAFNGTCTVLILLYVLCT